MDKMTVVQAAAVSGVFGLMALWEMMAPARAPRLGRSPRWRVNLGLGVLNMALVRILAPISALAAATLASDNGWGLLNRIAMPDWAAIACAVVLLDLVMYLMHVLFHAVPALWQLHAVHHADPDFDLTTGVRFHPLQIVVAAALKLAAITALGAPVVAVLIFEILLSAGSMFTHSNISLPAAVERWVKYLLVTPDMHRIHHSVVRLEHDSNYGFFFSVWDRLLGTYRQARAGALDIGLAPWRDRHDVATLSGALRMPFARERRPSRSGAETTAS
jgi:sterol desaturase/sphingolipid hydroxylase (fatty acid hydroxylase superfamily)